MDKKIKINYKGNELEFTEKELEEYIFYSYSKLKHQQKWISILLKQVKKWKSRYRNEKAKKESNMKQVL